MEKGNKMIRLVVSDMDGTLVPEGTANINPQLFDLIHALKKKGIAFAAASGRGYDSMSGLLAPVADEITFIAENGAYVVENGMPREGIWFSADTMNALIDYARSRDDAAYFIVSGPDGASVEGGDEALIRSHEEGYKLHYRRYVDLKKIDCPISKVAIFFKGDASDALREAKEQFPEGINIMTSGAHWVDFVPGGVEKGAAVKKLQERLGIKREETIAFGDNGNDISMLKAAGIGYAMKEAREEVKAVADHICGSVHEDGVLKVLEKLLKTE